MLLFIIERNGCSIFLCITVEPHCATKLARQGTLAVHFILFTSSKDTSVLVLNLSTPWTVKHTCAFVCRTRLCDRAPTSRYVRAFAFMLSQDGLWPCTWLLMCSSDFFFCLFYYSSLTKSLLKKVSVLQCTWNAYALRLMRKKYELNRIFLYDMGHRPYESKSYFIGIESYRPTSLHISNLVKG